MIPEGIWWFIIFNILYIFFFKYIIFCTFVNKVSLIFIIIIIVVSFSAILIYLWIIDLAWNIYNSKTLLQVTIWCREGEGGLRDPSGQPRLCHLCREDWVWGGHKAHHQSGEWNRPPEKSYLRSRGFVFREIAFLGVF